MKLKCKFCGKLDSHRMMHKDKYTGEYYHKACGTPLKVKGVAVTSKVSEITQYHHKGLWGKGGDDRFEVVDG